MSNWVGFERDDRSVPLCPQGFKRLLQVLHDLMHNWKRRCALNRRNCAEHETSVVEITDVRERSEASASLLKGKDLDQQVS